MQFIVLSAREVPLTNEPIDKRFVSDDYSEKDIPRITELLLVDLDEQVSNFAYHKLVSPYFLVVTWYPEQVEEVFSYISYALKYEKNQF